MILRARDRERTGQHEHGFSLMEMLVAIAILALVLALLPGSFRLARSTWTATAVLDREARVDSGRQFLQARLAEAMPLFEPAKSGIVSLAFSGAGETLSFIAPSPNGPQGAGLYRYALSTRPAGADGRAALVVAISAYAPQAKAAGDGTAEEHVLYADIAAARFRYFGRRDLRSQPAWHTEWTRRDALPDLVELVIDTGRTAGPILQPILVELRLRSTS